MTKEQHQEFIEFALELKWNRDAYSRARIIEELMDKVDGLVKNCSIPAVSGSLPTNSEFWEEWNKHQDIQRLWLWLLRRQ